MDTAHSLFEKIVGSNNSEIIVKSAHEIKKHFSNVSRKEPADEIGEELLYLLGGKKETFEWLLLLTILFVNDEKCIGYLSELNNKKSKISIKQSEWAILILSDIKSKMSDIHLDYCSKLIESIDKEIEIKKSMSFEEVNKDIRLEEERKKVKVNFWDKFGFSRKTTTKKAKKNPILKLRILEKNAPLEGINEKFIESVRKSLLRIESKYGPFAFVAIEQEQMDNNKYSVIVSAKWVKHNQQSGSIIGEKVYSNLNSNLKPLLGSVKAVFLENVPKMISGKEEDLKGFANAPKLGSNYRFEYGQTLSILAYDAKAFQNKS